MRPSSCLRHRPRDRNGESLKAWLTLRRRAAAFRPVCGAVGAFAPERPQHREVQPSRQIVRLVEAPVHAPPGVQRHRHRRVCVAEDSGPRRAHHLRERPGEHAPAFVLERVENSSQRPLVFACRARGVNKAGGGGGSGDTARGRR